MIEPDEPLKGYNTEEPINRRQSPVATEVDDDGNEVVSGSDFETNHVDDRTAEDEIDDGGALCL